ALPGMRVADDRGAVRLLQAGEQGDRRRSSVTETDATPPAGRPFAAGDRALLFDSKGRRYLVTLASGAEFHTHAGPVAHDDLIGREEGTTARSSRGGRYTAVRPT